MIFIIRTDAERTPKLDVKMVRRTPAIVPDSAGRVDFFCLGDPEAATAAGWPVVPVHDGWYADDSAGGMAIWGQGLFWEVRDTPFSVTQACGPEAWPAGSKPDADAEVNVRQAIFRG
ncbi:MAG TPA: hypothetical protein VGM42_05800 [Rhodopila sp.]|jgi:hypothetical protein